VEPQPFHNYTDAMGKEKLVNLTARLPEDVHAQAVALAREQRSSLNRLLVVAVERYIRQMKARQPKDSQDAR
jgi:HicB family